MGGPSPYIRDDGQRLASRQGPLVGFVEYANFDEARLVKMPQDIPFEVGSVLACAFITGFGGVLNRLDIHPNESALIVGCGGVGFSAIQAARFSGAFPVIAMDTMDSKLKLAEKMGATHTVNVKCCLDVPTEIKKITYGRGADKVAVCVAGSTTKKQAFLCMASRGTLLFIGSTMDETLAAFAPDNFIMTGSKITGALMGASKNARQELTRYMELYQHGLINIDDMFTGYYKLEQLDEAMDCLSQSGAVKNVIVMD